MDDTTLTITPGRPGPVALLYTGEYEDRKLVGVYATRQLAEQVLLKMTLADARPVAPEIEEWLVNES